MHRSDRLPLALAAAIVLFATGSAPAQGSVSANRPRASVPPQVLPAVDFDQAPVARTSSATVSRPSWRKPLANKSEDKPANKTATPLSPWTAAGALAVVIGLILVVARLFRKRAPQLQGLPNDALEILGRRFVDPRQSLVLVRVASKILVIGSSPAGLSPLGEIDDPIEVDLVAGFCRSASTVRGIGPSFLRMLKGQTAARPQSARGESIGSATTGSETDRSGTRTPADRFDLRSAIETPLATDRGLPKTSSARDEFATGSIDVSNSAPDASSDDALRRRLRARVGPATRGFFGEPVVSRRTTAFPWRQGLRLLLGAGALLFAAGPVSAQPISPPIAAPAARPSNELAGLPPLLSADFGKSLPADSPQNGPQPATGVPIDVDQMLSPSGMSSTLKIMLLLTVISLAPSILMMTTCFIRFVIVLGLLRQALGTQQIPPNQVLVALCLFLTFLVMSPVWRESYDQGIRPYSSPAAGEQPITLEEAYQRTARPVRRFMIEQLERTGNTESVATFLQFQQASSHENVAVPDDLQEVDTVVLLPAFLLSELKTSFVIGFQIYLPFLVIDMVISTVLISMGMMMLPPVLISLPFKLLLFVLIDGWALTVGMLLESVRAVT